MTNFEYILLKKLTNNGEFFRKTISILEKLYFKEIGNQELFYLTKEHYGKYKEIPTLVELVASVKNVPNSELRSEIVKSLKAIHATEEVQNVDFMLDETVTWIKDALYMQALQVGSEGLMKKDEAMKKKAEEILDRRAKVTIDRNLGLSFDDVDAMIEYLQRRDIGILTQHKELNKRLGTGFLPGTLSVILASSGVGKSLLMTDIISGMIKKNKNILLVSLEMADKEIMKRVYSNAMDLPINALSDLSKTEGELKALDREWISKEDIIAAYNSIKTSGTCGKLEVKDYPAGSFSALNLEQLVEDYRLEKGIEFDIIFVDYLGIMKSDLLSPGAGLYSYIKSIAEEVRSTAKKLGIAIISASQLNRSATNNIDDADNSNVSDSMGTVMTADFMMFLLQNEEMKERGEIVCKITKNRFTGRTDTWLMNVDYIHMRFNDIIIQDITKNLDISDITGVSSTNMPKVEDFGVELARRTDEADKFAKNEIKEIVREDFQKMEKINQIDPLGGDPMNAIFKDLGIEM